MSTPRRALLPLLLATGLVLAGCFSGARTHIATMKGMKMM